MEHVPHSWGLCHAFTQRRAASAQWKILNRLSAHTLHARAGSQHCADIAVQRRDMRLD